jgi:hypothetical protein
MKHVPSAGIGCEGGYSLQPRANGLGNAPVLAFEHQTMWQRVVDSSVLFFFSALYSCAVFLLRFRRVPPAPRTAVAVENRAMENE